MDNPNKLIPAEQAEEIRQTNELVDEFGKLLSNKPTSASIQALIRTLAYVTAYYVADTEDGEKLVKEGLQAVHMDLQSLALKYLARMQKGEHPNPQEDAPHVTH